MNACKVYTLTIEDAPREGAIGYLVATDKTKPVPPHAYYHKETPRRSRPLKYIGYDYPEYGFNFEQTDGAMRSFHVYSHNPNNYTFNICPPAEGGARKRVKHTRKSHRKMKRSQTKRRSA